MNLLSYKPYIILSILSPLPTTPAVMNQKDYLRAIKSDGKETKAQ